MIFKEEPNMDSDTLAVLQRGDTTITFITAKGEALNNQKFSVVLWNENSLILAISEDYLNSELDERIVSMIVDGMSGAEESISAEELRERSIEVFAVALSDVLDEAIDMVSNPDGANLDAAIEKLLGES